MCVSPPLLSAHPCFGPAPRGLGQHGGGAGCTHPSLAFPPLGAGGPEPSLSRHPVSRDPGSPSRLLGNGGNREARGSQGLLRPSAAEVRLSARCAPRGLNVSTEAGTAHRAGSIPDSWLRPPSDPTHPEAPSPGNARSVNAARSSQPASPAGCGPGSPGRGTCWGLPTPGATGRPQFPQCPCCPTSAAALLCVCFCQEGPGHLPPQGLRQPQLPGLGEQGGRGGGGGGPEQLLGVEERGLPRRSHSPRLGQAARRGGQHCLRPQLGVRGGLVGGGREGRRG